MAGTEPNDALRKDLRLAKTCLNDEQIRFLTDISTISTNEPEFFSSSISSAVSACISYTYAETEGGQTLGEHAATSFFVTLLVAIIISRCVVFVSCGFSIIYQIDTHTLFRLLVLLILFLVGVALVVVLLLVLQLLMVHLDQLRQDRVGFSRSIAFTAGRRAPLNGVAVGQHSKAQTKR